MAYGTTKKVSLSFDDAVRRAKDAFAEEGFGALCDINVRAKMKEKLDKEMDDYIILGMCNPALAYEALQKEHELGLLLPCNVIIYRQDGETYVSAVDPKVMLGIVGNAGLDQIAEQAAEKMRSALGKI